MIEAEASGDAMVPDGFLTLYVLTEGSGLVIMQTNASPEFTVMAPGHYTIHALVYDPGTLDLSIVVPGVTTGFDVNALLIQGGGDICASLDVEGASIHVDEPDAGGLTPVSMAVCLEDGTGMLEATPDGDMYVPDGYSVSYLLTTGEGLVYQEMGASPMFTISAYGAYTIHTLVYDPSTFDAGMLVPGTTTGLDIHAMLVQGGGTICAALDAGGATFFVIDCTPGDCDADAGTLSPLMSTVCLEDGTTMLTATPDGNMVVPEGFLVAYGLTMAGTGLVIEQVGTAPSFMVSAAAEYTIHTLVYDPETIDLSTIVPGVTTAVDITLTLLPLGTICAALDVVGATFDVIVCDDECMAHAGGLSPNAGQVCISGEGVMIGATPTGGLMVPDGFNVRYVLTSGAGLVIEQVSEDASFMVSATGTYRIHTLVYDPMTLDLSIVTPGVTTGFDVNALLIQGGGEICAALDVTGAVITVTQCPVGGDCPAYAGSLLPLKSIFCYVETGSVIGATVVGDAVVPPGYVARWVATQGTEMVIVGFGETAWFVVDGMGLHTIHTIVYNPATFDVSMIQLGTTTAAQVNAMLIQGGGEICASLDMEGVALYVEEPMTPTLTANMSQVCIEGGSATVSATAGGGMYLPMGYSYIHVLTKGEEKVIKELSMTPSFTVTETGHYTIHTFVYDPETFPLGTLTPGVSTAYDLQAMLVYGGGIYCAVLDMTGVSVHVLECDEDDCPAYAGSLLPLKSIFCYVETGSVIGATVVGDAVVPPGYVARWVATQGTEMVIVGFGETAWFVVDGMGLHTIHTIVYNPATFDVSMIQLGTTTAAQVNAMLIQGGGEICASLDMTGVALYVEEPSTPMLTATTDEVCLTGGTAVVSATAGAGMSLPMGYSYTHVLSMGYDKVIMEYSMTPSFTVTAAGHYTVHTFVYDPETFPLDMLTPGVSTAFDLHGMTVYGGGIYCAVLDVMGASVDVIVCEPVECVAFAGTLTAAAMETCLMEGSAMISAMGNADMVVPAGYSTAYVLTMDGVIMDTGSDLSFTVTGTGTYTIHTLVYHPATLDLGVVTPGVTTAAAVNALLIQGGGTICASLDLVGATTMVIVCEPVDCDAYAGTLTPHHFETCLADGSVVITAEGNDDMFVPEGYSTIYVLTMGGVIMDVGSALSFTVTSPGSYTFHTLVYDPTTLDLSIVTPGVTTAASVNALLIQGGGTICASLDLVGATTMVIDCTIDCPAAAGTISASMSDACLEEGMAMLVATPGGDAVVPEG
jgi:hypothetical protein